MDASRALNSEEILTTHRRAIERYGLGAIAFHWIMVVLVTVAGILGLLHDSWPKKKPTILDQPTRANWTTATRDGVRAVLVAQRTPTAYFAI
jgi:hypothetical protein